MKITILANRDLHANVALNLLRPLFEKHNVTVFLSESVGLPKKDWVIPEALKQLKFLEQALFNQVICPLAEQQKDKARYLTFYELGELGGNCGGNGCRVLENINQPEGLATFKASEPDLVISIRFGKIIKAPVILVPKLGVLNLHSGLLPQYQGILTTLHSLLAGESQVGCTLHYIDSGDIDTGSIIDTATVSVDSSVSLFGHVLKLYPLGVQMILKAVEQLQQCGQLDCYEQDVTRQRYFGLPETEHFTELTRQGFALWHQEEVIEVLQRYVPQEKAGEITRLSGHSA